MIWVPVRHEHEREPLAAEFARDPVEVFRRAHAGVDERWHTPWEEVGVVAGRPGPRGRVVRRNQDVLQK
jgi:hypothetical protein